MSANPTPVAINQPGSGASGWLDRLARRAVRARLQALQNGSVILIDGGKPSLFGAQDDSPWATVRVHDPRFYTEIAFGGSVGAGEAYMRGYWSCDDLTALVRIMLRNRELLDGMETGLARASAPALKAFHWLRRNTRRGSRRNIGAHYDLGNALFALMLDETMMYSCGIFEHEDSTLYDASVAKNERICRKLELTPGDHLLEIGTGWGGFAIHAARHYGCRVTTTTISEEQYALALERIEKAGLSGRITVLLEDYRNLKGRYDKLVSIEMIEAVGHAYYDAYFKTCGELLKPKGRMLLQAITIADQQYERAKRSVDFIQRYIFPGSCIPSVTALCNAITRASDMRLSHLEDIGLHYATTLRHWRQRFFANIDRVRALGYPERFIRMWEFYLCYCEGGFAERAISDVHILLTRSGYRSQ